MLKKIKNSLIKNKILFLILFFSFAISVAYSFHFKIQPMVDARSYDVIAINIVNGQGYREDLDIDVAYDTAIARIGPLYEYFLAGIYKIFGHHYEAVWLIQAALHALTAYLIYLICLLIFRETEKRQQIALIAAAIIGFYPDLIEISSMLMTETFYLFLVCLMLYIFFYYFDKYKFWSAMALGAVSGLAVLARPPVLFFIPVILFCFFKKSKILLGLVFLAVLLLVFTPWTVRNYKIYDRFMPFGTGGNFNFEIGNYHGATGEQEPSLEQYEFRSTHTMVESAGQSIKQFKSFIWNYPAEFLKLTLLRINKYFSVTRPMGFWFYQKGIGQLLFIFSSAFASVILFVFGLGGFIQSLKQRNPQLSYLLVFTIFTPLILFITVVETRYRFQIYPLLAVLAGFFAVDWWQKKNWWKNKIFWLAIIIIFSNSLLDFLLNIMKVKAKLGLF